MINFTTDHRPSLASLVGEKLIHNMLYTLYLYTQVYIILTRNPDEGCMQVGVNSSVSKWILFAPYIYMKGIVGRDLDVGSRDAS